MFGKRCRDGRCCRRPWSQREPSLPLPRPEACSPSGNRPILESRSGAQPKPGPPFRQQDRPAPGGALAVIAGEVPRERWTGTVLWTAAPQPRPGPWAPDAVPDRWPHPQMGQPPPGGFDSACRTPSIAALDGGPPAPSVIDPRAPRLEKKQLDLLPFTPEAPGGAAPGTGAVVRPPPSRSGRRSGSSRRLGQSASPDAAADAVPYPADACSLGN